MSEPVQNRMKYKKAEDAQKAADDAQKAADDAQGEIDALEVVVAAIDFIDEDELAAAIAAAKADVAALEAKLTAAMNTKVDQSAFNALAAEVANLKAQVEYLAGAQLKSLVFL